MSLTSNKSKSYYIRPLVEVAPVEWDVPISVFGVTVRPGQLIHADQHGFLVSGHMYLNLKYRERKYNQRSYRRRMSLGLRRQPPSWTGNCSHPHVIRYALFIISSNGSLERQQVLVPGRRAMATGVHPSVTAARMQEVSCL